MLSQTIALFRYQFLMVINRKNLFVVFAIYISAIGVSQFSAELAIINSNEVAVGVLADYLRYSLVLYLAISICHQIAQDYELGQFDRLLAMPIARWQYVLSQFLVVCAFAWVMCIPVFLMMTLNAEFSVAIYWTLAVYQELILVGLISMLATLSLEKLPISIIFTFAMYVLTKLVPLISYIFNQSSLYYEDDKEFQLGSSVISIMQFVLPDMTIFAQNNFLYGTVNYADPLRDQLISLLIYGAFMMFIILFDFYRKEIKS